MLIFCIFAVSLSFAQTSDEKGLGLRRQRIPEKNLVQSIATVPAVIIKFPFYITGNAVKDTAIFIGDKSLIPRIKALLTSDDRLTALYPTVNIGGRSGLGGDLKFFDKRFLKKGNKLSLQASYTTNKHQNHYIRYQIPEMVGPFFLDTRGGYQVITNEDFFGIGNNSNRDDRTNFRHEKLGGYLIIGAELTRWLKTRFHADYMNHVIENGAGTYDSTLDKFDSKNVPGLEGAALLCLGGSIAFDTRDNDLSPSKGGLAEFAATVFNQVDGDKYGFTRYTLKLSHYIPLFRIGRVLTVQLEGEINTRFSDNKTTPFFERASLGGSTSLRGYSTGRFRDKDLILLNVEYRYPIWDSDRDRSGAIDAVIFTDVGRVFNNLWEDTFRNYKVSYGFGIRVRTIYSFLFRAEIARSSEETNLILKFEPIF